MAQPMIQNPVPEMHEFERLGAYLRALREHFGLDAAEVSRRTHIRTKYIQAMEAEQLEALPGKVYARGYVVTYAEFFGLDAESFASQYMAQFEAAGAPAKEPAYFIPEPKRREIKQKQSRKFWWMAGAAAAALVALFLLSREGEQSPADTTVMDVPERLVEQLRNGLMPIERNVECLTGQGWLSCLSARPIEPHTLYVTRPPMLYSTEEAADVAEEEADEGLIEDANAPVVAEPETVKAEAVTPEAAKPEAPKTEVKKPEAAKKSAEAATPEKVAVPEDAPFKRQGEADAPKAETKPVEDAPKEKPEAAKAEVEEKPADDGLLPSGWFDAPQGYQDPNAAGHDEWTPRRRR